MGKKSRNKKSVKKQVVANQAKAVTPMGNTPASLSGKPMAAQPAGQTKNQAKAAQLLDAQTEFIRSDIVRIVLLLVLVAVILGGLFLVNHKTDYLHKGGDKLGSFLRL